MKTMALHMTLVDWNRQEHEQIRTPGAIESEALPWLRLTTLIQEPHSRPPIFYAGQGSFCRPAGERGAW
jgi:hypothetical protein